MHAHLAKASRVSKALDPKGGRWMLAFIAGQVVSALPYSTIGLMLSLKAFFMQRFPGKLEEGRKGKCRRITAVFKLLQGYQ
jgi:hypothetical protein